MEDSSGDDRAEVDETRRRSRPMKGTKGMKVERMKDGRLLVWVRSSMGVIRNL